MPRWITIVENEWKYNDLLRPPQLQGGTIRKDHLRVSKTPKSTNKAKTGKVQVTQIEIGSTIRPRQTRRERNSSRYRSRQVRASRSWGRGVVVTSMNRIILRAYKSERTECIVTEWWKWNNKRPFGAPKAGSRKTPQLVSEGASKVGAAFGVRSWGNVAACICLKSFRTIPIFIWNLGLKNGNQHWNMQDFTRSTSQVPV